MSKFMPGLLLVAAGLGYFFVADGGVKVSVAAFAFGAVLILLSLLGHACVDCNTTMSSKEYGLAPELAPKVKSAIEGEDMDALAALIRGPQISNRADHRAGLDVGYCPKCGKVATLLGMHMDKARGNETLGEREVFGEKVTKLTAAVADVNPR
jgi:hypothetical protein